MTKSTTKPSDAHAKVVESLRRFALAFPGTEEDFPWGHSAFKAGAKVFAFLGADGDGLGISVKLPNSSLAALELPFAEPTGYGLGKHGWVSASFKAKAKVPLALLESWMEESFRAIAPKKLVKALDLLDDAAAAPKKPVGKGAAAAKPTKGTPVAKAKAKAPVKAKPKSKAAAPKTKARPSPSAKVVKKAKAKGR